MYRCIWRHLLLLTYYLSKKIYKNVVFSREKDKLENVAIDNYVGDCLGFCCSVFSQVQCITVLYYYYIIIIVYGAEAASFSSFHSFSNMLYVPFFIVFIISVSFFYSEQYSK